MGNNQSTDFKLTGDNITKHEEERKLVGKFINGEFVKGTIYCIYTNRELASGDFKNGYLYKGRKLMYDYNPFRDFTFSCETKFETDLHNHFINNKPLYIIGEFEDGVPHGQCIMYYNDKYKLKCFEGIIEYGKIVDGKIYAPNRTNIVLESGSFDEILYEGSVLYEVLNPVVGVVELLYMQVTKDKNDLYNGDTFYYYDSELKKIALKCELKEGVLENDCMYYSESGDLLFDGYCKDGRINYGLMCYKGKYVMSSYENGLPNGSSKIYKSKDAKKENLIAEGYYSNGVMTGCAKYYDKPKPYTILYNDKGDKLSINDPNIVSEKFDIVGRNKIYTKWLEMSLRNKDWLKNYIITDMSHFKYDTTDNLNEFELEVYDQAEKLKITYGESFVKLLDAKKDEYFARTLKADISKLYIDYCELNEYTGLIKKEEKDKLVLSAKAYIIRYSTETNDKDKQDDKDEKKNTDNELD